MSDTPRTDAESCWLFEGLSEVVTADFARGLERELDEDRRDAERYRWLKENASDIRWEGCHVVRATMHCLDVSIDAAMKEGK